MDEPDNIDPKMMALPPTQGQQSSPTPDNDACGENDMEPSYGSGTGEVLRKLGAGKDYKGAE